MLLIAASPRNDCASIVALWLALLPSKQVLFLPVLPSKPLAGTTIPACKSLRGAHGLLSCTGMLHPCLQQAGKQSPGAMGILLRSIVVKAQDCFGKAGTNLYY
jgi:hypothetical protein